MSSQSSPARRPAPRPTVRVQALALALAGCAGAAQSAQAAGQIASAGASPAATAVAATGAARDYRIPAGPLGPALMRLAAESGINLSLRAAQVEGRATQGLAGRYSVQAALDALLQHSGLSAVPVGQNGYVLQAAAATAPAPAPPPARPAAPSEAAQGSALTELSAVTVTARTQNLVMAPTQAVTVLDRPKLEVLRLGSDSVATLLAKATPGMAGSSHTLTDYGQTLRGRNMLVLVDGVPLNTGRDSSRNLTNINPFDIEQIEVLRGSSALYGGGAPGGVISIRTRRPDGQARMETALTGVAALSHLSAAGLGGEFQHYLSGGRGAADYSLSLGLRRVGGSYDGKGRRIAPEPAQGDLFDSEVFNGSAKLGFDFGADQRLQLSLSHYDAKQDTDYAADPSVARFPAGSRPARAVRGLRLERQNRVRNTLAGLEYEHRDLAGSTLAAQLYYRDFFTRFPPFDARAVSVRGANVDQAIQESDVLGGRLTVKTPFGSDRKTLLVWGADFNRERSQMPLDVFDPALYDASGGRVFDKIGERLYMPRVTTRSFGVLGQLQHKFDARWSAEVGIRHDRAKASFDDFMPLSQSRVPDPRPVRGGTVDYASTIYNAGLIFAPASGQEFYAAYRQGFELPDIGVVVRNATPAFDIDSSNLRPVKTKIHELGWRGTFSRLSASVNAFQSRSDLGAVQSFNNGLVLLRTREKVQGIEAELDYADANSDWSGGGSVSWLKGRELPQGGAGDQDMSGYRIPPLKLTGYIEYRPSERWHHRIQATSFSSKDYRLRGRNSFGRYDTRGYVTVDWASQWSIDRHSKLSIGVENLFDRYYFPLYSQLLRSGDNTSRLPAPGAVLKVGYSYLW